MRIVTFWLILAVIGGAAYSSTAAEKKESLVDLYGACKAIMTNLEKISRDIKFNQDNVSHSLKMGDEKHRKGDKRGGDEELAYAGKYQKELDHSFAALSGAVALAHQLGCSEEEVRAVVKCGVVSMGYNC